MASIGDIWSEDEDEFLRSNYLAGVRLIDICNRLPGRTYDAVSYRLKVLCIQRKVGERKPVLSVVERPQSVQLNSDLDIVKFSHWEEQEMLQCDGYTIADCMSIFKDRKRFEIKLLAKRMDVSLSNEE